MSRWHTIIAGAVAGGAVALAGCGSSGPGSAGSNGAPQASRPAVTSPRAGTAAPPSAAPGTTQVSLSSSAPVPYTGEVVELTVQASAGTGTPQPRLASATVSFGDGAA